MNSFFLLSGFLAVATASAQVLEFEGRYWFTRTDSQILMEKFGVATSLDLKNDLGVGDPGFAEAQVTYSHHRSNFRFDFTPIRYSGDSVVDRTIRFNNRLYTLGTRVVSDIEVNALRFSWTYFLFHAADGRLKVGSVLEGNGFLQNLSLKAPTLGVAQTSGLSVGVPAVGVAAEFSAYKRLRFSGEVAGMTVGRYGSFLRSEVAAKLAVAPHLAITAGYRTFDLHADYRPDFVQLKMNGPFAGASLRF